MENELVNRVAAAIEAKAWYYPDGSMANPEDVARAAIEAMGEPVTVFAPAGLADALEAARRAKPGEWMIVRGSSQTQPRTAARPDLTR
jgi:hypothetical protein